MAVPLYRNPVVFQSPDILALPRKKKNAEGEEEKKKYTATKKRHQKLFSQFICIKHFKVEVIRLVLQ